MNLSKSFKTAVSVAALSAGAMGCAHAQRPASAPQEEKLPQLPKDSRETSTMLVRQPAAPAPTPAPPPANDDSDDTEEEADDTPKQQYGVTETMEQSEKKEGTLTIQKQCQSYEKHFVQNGVEVATSQGKKCTTVISDSDDKVPLDKRVESGLPLRSEKSAPTKDKQSEKPAAPKKAPAAKM